MKKIVLHIGMPKTGSSAIQAFLALNQRLLKKQGINYPNPLPFTQPYQTSSGNGIPLKEMISTGDYDSIKKYIKKKCYNSLINVFSSEAFYDEFATRQTNFFQTLKDFDVHIIIYVRRQDLYIQSAFNQGVKNHGFRNLNCLNALIKNADFAPPLLNSLHYIDSSKITVRPYENCQFTGGDIYHDFISTLNIKWNDSFKLPEKFVNPSLSYDALKFRIFLNEIGIDSANWQEKVTWNRYLQNYSVYQLENNTYVPYSIFNNENRMQIIQQFAPTNKKIAESFIPDNKQFLFEEKVIIENLKELTPSTLDTIDFQSIIRFIYSKHAMMIHNLSSFISVNRNYSASIIQKITQCQQTIKHEINTSHSIKTLIHNNIQTITNNNIPLNSNKEINTYNFEKEVLFIHPSMQHKHSDDGFIHLVLSMPNSFFVLKPIMVDKSTNKVKIELDILPPEQTFLKIFFQTYNEPWDSEEKSIYYPLVKGENRVDVIIIDDFLNGKIRIDPGKTKGEYIIKKIQIKYKSNNRIYLFRPRFMIRIIDYLVQRFR